MAYKQRSVGKPSKSAVDGTGTIDELCCHKMWHGFDAPHKTKGAIDMYFAGTRKDPRAEPSIRVTKGKK